MSAVNQADDQPKTKTQAGVRAERLAAALKANLRRRKAQARQRAGPAHADATADEQATPPGARRNEE